MSPADDCPPNPAAAAAAAAAAPDAAAAAAAAVTAVIVAGAAAEGRHGVFGRGAAGAARVRLVAPRRDAGDVRRIVNRTAGSLTTSRVC
jgi:hypothetical protein